MTLEAKTTQPNQLTAVLLRDGAGNYYITRSPTEAQIISIFEYLELLSLTSQNIVYVDSRLPQPALDRISARMAARDSNSGFKHLQIDLGESIELPKSRFRQLPRIVSFAKVPKACRILWGSTDENILYIITHIPEPLRKALFFSSSKGIVEMLPNKPSLLTSSSPGEAKKGAKKELSSSAAPKIPSQGPEPIQQIVLNLKAAIKAQGGAQVGNILSSLDLSSLKTVLYKVSFGKENGPTQTLYNYANQNLLDKENSGAKLVLTKIKEYQAANPDMEHASQVAMQFSQPPEDDPAMCISNLREGIEKSDLKKVRAAFKSLAPQDCTLMLYTYNFADEGDTDKQTLYEYAESQLMGGVKTDDSGILSEILSYQETYPEHGVKSGVLREFNK